MNSTEKNNLEKPTLIQTIGAVLVAAFMWGSGNVLSRSLLIEGVNEIFLVTLRVTLIGLILFLNYFLFMPYNIFPLGLLPCLLVQLQYLQHFG